jgi:hypothetical protein
MKVLTAPKATAAATMAALFLKPNPAGINWLTIAAVMGNDMALSSQVMNSLIIGDNEFCHTMAEAL